MTGLSNLYVKWLDLQIYMWLTGPSNINSQWPSHLHVHWPANSPDQQTSDLHVQRLDPRSYMSKDRILEVICTKSGLLRFCNIAFKPERRGRGRHRTRELWWGENEFFDLDNTPKTAWRNTPLTVIDWGRIFHLLTRPSTWPLWPVTGGDVALWSRHWTRSREIVDSLSGSNLLPVDGPRV